MKRLTALLLALALTFSLAACVREGPVETQPEQTTPPTGSATENQVYVEPDPTDREPTIRLLNHDPGTDAAWRALAKAHTEATGIQVIAMTTASGAYGDVLPGQLGGSSPVTVFFTAGPEDIPVSCADLSGTAAYAALTDPTLALTVDGQVVGLPFHTESYGLMVNMALLEKAGFTAPDLLTPEGLERVVASVTERAGDLGFQAFAVPALGSSEFACFLYAAAENEPELIRPLLDLVLNNHGGDLTKLLDRTSADTFDAFLNGQALFCLAFSRDLEPSEHIRILPIPTAEGSIIGLDSEGYWCVNADAIPGDTEASMAFLDKTLTEDISAFENRCLPYGEGTLDTFTLQALELEARRAALVSPDADRLALLTEILSIYAADPSEENWLLVRDALRK